MWSHIDWHDSKYTKSLATCREQWKTTIDLPHMNLIIFPASACPTSLHVQAQLWFSLVQLACCKTFAICCNNFLPFLLPQLLGFVGLLLSLFFFFKVSAKLLYTNIPTPPYSLCLSLLPGLPLLSVFDQLWFIAFCKQSIRNACK